ncbi:MAG: GntR family transcriptional regulator [Bacillota bacterium]
MRPNEVHKTKAEEVYEALRSEIISGTLPPGARVVIREVASRFDVSEIPVREAMKRLESEGLVVSTPYVGTVVSSPSIQDLKETMVIRSALEALAARLSAPALTEADIDRLRELLAHMEECKTQRRFWDYSKADREFHSLLYSRCNNSKLLRLIEELWNRSERARAIFNVMTLSAEQSLQEHRQMLEAVLKRDYDLLAKVVSDQKIRVSIEVEDFVGKNRNSI